MSMPESHADRSPPILMRNGATSTNVMRKCGNLDKLSYPDKRRAQCLDKKHVLCLNRIMETYFCASNKTMRNATAIKMHAVPCRDLAPETHS